MGPSTRREVQRSTLKFGRTIEANFKLFTSNNAIPTLNPKTTDSTIRYQSGCVPGMRLLPRLQIDIADLESIQFRKDWKRSRCVRIALFRSD